MIWCSVVGTSLVRTGSGGRNSGVLEDKLIDQIDDFLSEIKPMRIFDPDFVKSLMVITSSRAVEKNGPPSFAKTFATSRPSIANRVVVIWCGSTESSEVTPAMESVAALEKGIENNDSSIPPSMIYAYAASWKTAHTPTACQT